DQGLRVFPVTLGPHAQSVSKRLWPKSHRVKPHTYSVAAARKARALETASSWPSVGPPQGVCGSPLLLHQEPWQRTNNPTGHTGRCFRETSAGVVDPDALHA